MLLSADAGRNVIFGYHPSVTESGYNLGARQNFITSITGDNETYVWNDTLENKKKEKSFRPSDVTIGTDGSIYIVDWYDPVVGGHQMKDSIGYGRIFRITPKNKKLIAPTLDFNTIQGQIEALKNPAVNVRNIAFEKLKQQGAAVIAPVKKLLQDENPYVRARAIWLLAQLGMEGKQEVEKVLTDKDEKIRATAFKSLRQVNQNILPWAKQLSIDPSSFVRREVAVALRDSSFKAKREILLTIAGKYDGKDKWYLETLGSAMEAEADIWYKELINLFYPNQTSVPLKWSKPMTNFAWRLHSVNAVNDIAQRAVGSSLSLEDRAQMITALAFINDKTAANAMVQLTNAPLADVKEQALYWVSFRQNNDWFRLVDWSKINVNTSYQRKLAFMKGKLQLLLDSRQPLKDHKRIVKEMALDSMGGQIVIGLMAENKLPVELMPAVAEHIFNNPDLGVRVQAGNYVKRTGTDKMYSVSSIAKLVGDAKAGNTIFINNCSSCHMVELKGNRIGPELTQIGKKFDKIALLDAMVNPSASIVFGYESWLVNTKDGESVFGFLISENKQSIVIKDISGVQHVIAQNKISSKKKQEKSLMPEPSTTGLTEKNLADIAAYLLLIKAKP